MDNELVEKVVEEITPVTGVDFFGDLTGLAESIIALVTEQVKAECKAKIREVIQHNYACIHNGGKLKGLGDVILDIDEV